MVDAVAAGARHPPLQANDLRDQPIMARQGDVARGEQRQHVPEQIGLGLLAHFVADAVLAERLPHELAAVVIANNLADTPRPMARTAAAPRGQRPRSLVRPASLVMMMSRRGFPFRPDICRCPREVGDTRRRRDLVGILAKAVASILGR